MGEKSLEDILKDLGDNSSDKDLGLNLKIQTIQEQYEKASKDRDKKKGN